ncbi:sterol desaturase family protein [Arachidicoccus rhizosphaerae]|jgi:sterol desaturase/sphingolipid hydroxylase (fatty acid hydroxylase superfamily)|uniref:sterol desaturase family protein n=1 Tax=Arachidicoccus rhizosphaerae TaxID=551991 RepID=UPI000B8407C3|nr:sterol desaturase family protein [Arachidicoccus rhizosphaerae]
MILNTVCGLFAAPKIPYEQILHLENKAPNLIVYAIPFMAFFTLLEMWVSWREKHKLYKVKESIGSTLVGLGNVLINLLLKVGLLYFFVWLYNVLPWRMELQWWTLIPCYILFDFCSYWAHRFSHSQRFLWSTHVVHHSAESYNLTVSFRLSWIQNIKIIFFIPVALCGFHPLVFFVVSQISVLFQFWVHTEYIKKLPWIFEYILATPSNHRVHHGSQEKYLDKNFAATFIFWDRLFRTYQKEEEPPVYGLTTKIGNRLNPIYLNFHELKDIWQDVRKAKGWRKKWFYLFGSPVAIDLEKKGKSVS